jgi:hypothetical protein
LLTVRSNRSRRFSHVAVNGMEVEMEKGTVLSVDNGGSSNALDPFAAVATSDWTSLRIEPGL